MKLLVPKVPLSSNAALQATNVTHPSSPQRMKLHVGSVVLRGFGHNAGSRFHHALQEAMMQGMQQRPEFSFTHNLQLDRISIPPLAAGATVEDAARQVARGLLRTLEKRADKSNEKERGESAHG